MGSKNLLSETPFSTKRYLVLIIIFTVVYFLSSCYEAAAAAASCGNIRNISCPFKLKGDHQKCKASFFTQELSCLNNRTVLYLLPDKLLYYVESINYDELSIRIVDPGLQKNNPASRPLRSLAEEDLQQYAYRDGYGEPMLSLSRLNQPVAMIDCPYRVNSTRYINITSPTSSYVLSVLGKDYIYTFAYLVAGFLPISEIKANCRISKVTWVSLRSPNIAAIHDAMIYGFEIPWSYFYCLKCKATRYGKDSCNTQYLDYRLWDCKDDSPTCNFAHIRSYNFTLSCLRGNIRALLRSDNAKIALGMYFVARFVFGLPLLLALLAYRARRRHLSMYDTIEDFLQAHNNLMPIRYAYSDIKKITNNFGDKLGEGGFGTVYKGKLRSGVLVAVKMLGKSAKATGKEFINEVATSGRIHHVN